jgi:hypothetical protein
MRAMLVEKAEFLPKPYTEADLTKPLAKLLEKSAKK